MHTAYPYYLYFLCSYFDTLCNKIIQFSTGEHQRKLFIFSTTPTYCSGEIARKGHRIIIIIWPSYVYILIIFNRSWNSLHISRWLPAAVRSNCNCIMIFHYYTTGDGDKDTILQTSVVTNLNRNGYLQWLELFVTFPKIMVSDD